MTNDKKKSADKINRSTNNKTTYTKSASKSGTQKSNNITAQKSGTQSKKNSYVSVIIKRHRDVNGNHPHIILDNIENNHVSVGLSTKKNKGKGSTNYTLDINPLGGSEKSYMRRQGIVATKNHYYNAKNGNMTQKDYVQAKVYGERAKQKYLSKKNKKK